MMEIASLKRRITALVLLTIVVSTGFGLVTWWVAINSANLDEIIAVVAGAIVGLIVAAAMSQWLSHLFSQPLEYIQHSLEILGTSSPNLQALPKPEDLSIGQEITKEVLKDIYDLTANQHDSQLSIASDNEVMHTLLDASAAAIIALDRNGLVKYANQAALDLAPPSLENVLGVEFDKAFPLEYPDETTLKGWIKSCQSDIVNATNAWQRIKLEHFDGIPRYFDAVASFSKEESHGFETLVALIDFSDVYEDDNREVSFVSLAVHELRSLITVLRGYIEVFEDEIGPSLEHEHTAFMNKMSVSAAQLSTFVNNLLNVARLENDQMKVHMQKEDWLEVIKSTSDDMRLRAEVRNRHLKYILPKKLPPVAVDRVSIYEVMSNLIDNAIKYSLDGGEIIIKVENKGEGIIETTVQDHGIGIPASVMNHLFDKFYRSHRSRENIGGTGLGLYLSKQITEAHNGSIWVKSVEGEGATFGFTIPTYASVADQLKASGSRTMVRSAHGWINNHGSVRR